MHNKEKPWFDDQCTRAFGIKQETHIRWTRDRSRVNCEKLVSCQVRANETYSKFARSATGDAVFLDCYCFSRTITGPDDPMTPL